MDKTGADLDYSIQTIKDRLGAKVGQLHVNIGAADDFVGFVDVLKNKAFIFDGSATED